MPEFQVGVDIVTASPTVEVTTSDARPLLPGLHRFQLIVEDDAGNVSDPVVLDVTVQQPAVQRPVAVIALVGDPPSVGSPFTLDATASSDPEGQAITSYTWTLFRTEF